MRLPFIKVLAALVRVSERAEYGAGEDVASAGAVP